MLLRKRRWEPRVALALLPCVARDRALDEVVIDARYVSVVW